MSGKVSYKYSYSGPVLEFDHLIAGKWNSTTIASSERKAKSNLAYQFKSQTKRLPNAKITLPGKLKLIETILE